MGLTALLERIASESLGTVANGIAIVDLAGGVETARRGIAGICRLPRVTENLRIALVARRTATTSLAIVHLTIGVLAATVLGADVHATTIETIAQLVRRTVLVVLANVLVVVDC